MQENIILILFSFGLIILGIVVIAFGYKKLAIFDRLKKEGVKTIGEIEQVINPDISITSKASYVPVVRFIANNEVIVEVPKNSIRSNPTFYTVGERYSIYYHGDNPLTFAIEKWTEKACAWTMIFGGCFFIIGAVFTYLEKI